MAGARATGFSGERNSCCKMLILRLLRPNHRFQGLSRVLLRFGRFGRLWGWKSASSYQLRVARKTVLFSLELGAIERGAAGRMVSGAGKVLRSVLRCEFSALS
jgi:hypothetical protein